MSFVQLTPYHYCLINMKINQIMVPIIGELQVKTTKHISIDLPLLLVVPFISSWVNLHCNKAEPQWDSFNGEYISTLVRTEHNAAFSCMACCDIQGITKCRGATSTMPGVYISSTIHQPWIQEQNCVFCPSLLRGVGTDTSFMRIKVAEWLRGKAVKSLPQALALPFIFYAVL